MRRCNARDTLPRSDEAYLLVNWQVRYAINGFSRPSGPRAEHVVGDLIKVVTENRPDVLAAISDAETIDEALAIRYKQQFPELDFLCGYRTTCVWEGGAIRFLEGERVGWGNFGTLSSAAQDGNANTASHKIYKFSDRLLRQYGRVEEVTREFDRVHQIRLKDGRVLRIGMIAEYEPTADAVRTLWDRFGPVDVIWNINPNGNITREASAAGRELGCEVVKWDELKSLLA